MAANTGDSRHDGGELHGAEPGPQDKHPDSIHKTHSQFGGTRGNDVIGTTALSHYGGYLSEEQCRFLGDGRASGCWKSAATSAAPCRIWGTAGDGALGVDISSEQTEKAGFILEHMAEHPHRKTLRAQDSAFAQKAKMLPVASSSRRESHNRHRVADNMKH